jgi:hypothetical protein
VTQVTVVVKGYCRTIRPAHATGRRCRLGDKGVSTLGEKGQLTPPPTPGPSQADRRGQISACIGEISAAGLGDAGERAIQLLRGVLVKGDITDSDFAFAQSVCREVLGPGH